MRSIPTICLYLNKSYQTDSGLHPVKVRITYRRKSRYYKTGYFLNEDDFKKSYGNLKPRGKYIELKSQLLKIEQRASEILENISPFSFEEFNDKFYDVEKVPDNVLHSYDRKIEELDNAKKYGSKNTFEYSKKAIMGFVEIIGIKELSFRKISPKFLYQFEQWMTEQGKSKTTIGIYLRCLRSLYNEAIHEKTVARECYPFGQRQNGLYSIPVGNNTKKALSQEDIKLIQDFQNIYNPGLEIARDFWLLSFYCAGINSADLLRLRQKDYNGKSITFIRHKTKSTCKVSKETVLYLPAQAINLIEKHKTESSNPNSFLFGILDGKDSLELQRKKVNNFNNMVRKQMNKLAEALEIPVKLGMMHARHSFANVAWNKQIPVSYIADCMAHTSIKTTSSYLKSISDENRAETMNVIFEGL